MLHIYCGDGVGKTTASVGLSIRAAGHGMKVLFCQFMKSGESGELNVLRSISNIDVLTPDCKIGFVWKMTEAEKDGVTDSHNRMLKYIIKNTHKYDLIVMDEFNSTYELGMIDRNSSYEYILETKNVKELVLTGRNPDKKFCDIADYISEIQFVKHPYEKGIPARKGIEF